MSTSKTLGAANIVDVFASSLDDFMTRVDAVRSQFFLAVEAFEESDSCGSCSHAYSTVGTIPLEGIAFSDGIARIPVIDFVHYQKPSGRIGPFAFSLAEAMIRLSVCRGWCGMCPRHHIVHSDKKYRWQAERYVCAIGDAEIAERLSTGFGPVSALHPDDIACVLVRAGEVFNRPISSIPSLAAIVPDRVRVARERASAEVIKAFDAFARAYDEQMQPFGIKLLSPAVHIDGFSLDGSWYGHWSTHEERAMPSEHTRAMWVKRGWYKLENASREVERSRKYLDSLPTV